MIIEDFKKMMETRFSLDGKKVKLIEERPDYVKMEADISIGPIKLFDSLHWRKEEIDFCKSLENEQVRFLAYYHRTSDRLTFDQRNFYFVIKGKDGEDYPNYMTIYMKDGEVVIGDDKDFFFPKNKKQDEAVDVLEEELRILKALNQYYTEN